MKIIHYDRKSGEMKLSVETLDDLWMLKDIIQKGDVLKGSTVRSIDMSGKKERRKIFVVLEAEKSSFGSDELRVQGLIKEASEDIPHGHHTFEVRVGDVFTLVHKWKDYEIERIRSSSHKINPILVCVLDDDECDVFEVSTRIRRLAHFSGSSGKMYASDNEKYYKDIINFLKSSEIETVAIVGPGFAKERVYKGLEKKKYIDSVSSTGIVGLNEAIRRGILKSVMRDSEISKDTDMIEKFFTELKKDGLVVYGRDETLRALENGAVDMLLISDRILRENEDVLEKAKQMRTKIHIISSKHPSGEQFYNFGGIGGFLRFKL